MKALTWPEFSRRGFLLAAASIPILKGESPACVLASEQEEGPYYVERAALRRDITEGKPGMPLTLRIALVDARKCTPLAATAIDLWHCDAEGVYSGFTEYSRREFGRGRGPMPPDSGDAFASGMRPPPPGARGPRKIDATRFLRGVQISNKAGMVEFATLYPGWYEGRAIHIHLKTRVGGEAADGHVAHTGQLFFPEDVTERIAKLEPYAKHLNVHRTIMEQDGIFGSQHGSSSIVRLERIGSGPEPQGFVAAVTLAIDPEATPKPVRGGPPPFPR